MESDGRRHDHPGDEERAQASARARARYRLLSVFSPTRCIDERPTRNSNDHRRRRCRRRRRRRPFAHLQERARSCRLSVRWIAFYIQFECLARRAKTQLARALKLTQQPQQQTPALAAIVADALDVRDARRRARARVKVGNPLAACDESRGSLIFQKFAASPRLSFSAPTRLRA